MPNGSTTRELEITDAVARRDGPVHQWFELTRAEYLTIPRSVLQSMPVEWQERFAACLEELDATFDWRPDSGRYWVELRDDRGRICHDPLKEYRHADVPVLPIRRSA